VFNHDDHTWQAVSFEDEDDTFGTIEMEGQWDDEGHMFYPDLLRRLERSESAVPDVSPSHHREWHFSFADAGVDGVVHLDQPLGQRGPVLERAQ
jgi:hypothetical protein